MTDNESLVTLDPKPRVLVLCTGNSCRSQMAAAYLERFAGDRLEVASAGTRPAAEIHPLTRVVLAEDGVDLGDRRPLDVQRFLELDRIDHLIVVCDGAARECPTAWPAVRSRLSWPFADPAVLTGSEAERLAGFRRVRDEIKERTREWVVSLETSPSAPTTAAAP